MWARRGETFVSMGTLPPSKCSVGADEFSVGAGKCSVGADEFSVGADEFSVGADEFSVGADEFSVGANQFSVGAALPIGRSQRTPRTLSASPRDDGAARLLHCF